MIEEQGQPTIAKVINSVEAVANCKGLTIVIQMKASGFAYVQEGLTMGSIAEEEHLDYIG